MPSQTRAFAPIAAQRRLNKLLSSRYFQAAVACLVVGGTFIGWRLLRDRSGVNEALVALNAVHREKRQLEARITALQRYSPFVQTRDGRLPIVNHPEENRIALTLLNALNDHPDATTEHALGAFYLAEGQVERATELLQKAVDSKPNSAQYQCDLGAALFESGKAIKLSRGSGASFEEFAKSLDHLDTALSQTGAPPEAIFNRALLRERMLLPWQAKNDWREYLAMDHDSPWAIEAQTRLRNLEESYPANSPSSKDLSQELVEASLLLNKDLAFDVICQNTDAIAGKLSWWQLLGRHLAQRTNGDEAKEHLRAMTFAGRVFEERTGDRFISELARFYQSLSGERLRSLATAHATVDEAHSLLAASDTGKAGLLYEEAYDLFEASGDELEKRFIAYWLGYCQYRESRFSEALSTLGTLERYCRAKSYLWLLQKSLTMIANTHGDLSDFSSAIAAYNEAAGICTKLKDVYDMEKNFTSLAYTYDNLGGRQESFGFMHDALQSAGSCWPGGRQMYRNYDTAAGILESFGYHAAAIDYEKAALQTALDEADPVFQYFCYLRLATIFTQKRDYEEALKQAQAGYRVADSIPGEQDKLAPLAHSCLQLADTYKQAQDYQSALSYYDRAVSLYESVGLFPYVYAARKGRLLCYRGQADDARTLEELKSVLSLFEQYRSKIKEEKNRNSFFDMEQGVYDVAIDFAYSRLHDYQQAFEYSEISRGRSLLDIMIAGTAGGYNQSDIIIRAGSEPLTFNAIQQAIPNSAQLLQYAVLDDKLLMWVVSKNSLQAAERPISQAELTQRVVRYRESALSAASGERGEARHRAQELYSILIEPVKPFLDSEKQTVIVADKVLNYLPFNALICPSTDKYLINDYLLSFAPSSNAFVQCTQKAAQKAGTTSERVLAVGDPQFDRSVFPDLPALPSSGREASDVAKCYQVACSLIANEATKARLWSEIDGASVIHLASHYITDEQNPMLSKLLLTDKQRGFSNRRQSENDLLAYEVCKHRLPATRLVVLSACRTGVETYLRGEGMIGMSRTFLAAGVPLVVASLWPVDSERTVDFMVRFHQYRKQLGLATAQALRRAQLDMMTGSDGERGEPFYWAPFILIGGYANF